MPDALPPPSLAPEPAVDWSARVERISLQRAPASAQAHQLTLELATLMEPLLGRDRQLGTTGRRAHQNQVGVILAGLLKAGLRGQKVRAQRGKARPWTASAVGQDVFWRKVEAMERAGLVRIYAGIGFFRAGRITGKAAAIECTMALLRVAENAGLSADTFAADFPLTADAQAQRSVIKPDDLVACFKVPQEGEDSRTRCSFPPEQAQHTSAVLAQLQQLNAHLASASVAGCVPPVLRRLFFADLRLGGRFQAIGGETFQGMRRRDRHLLRINGAPVVEVDLRAAALSIFLALKGRPIPGDPYTHGPLSSCDREAVKAWFVQTLNTGRPAARWSEKHPPAVRELPIRPVSAGAMATYPELHDMVNVLPADLASSLPLGRAGWALGQWLVGLEAKVMEDTLSRLLDAGVVALPLHDALLVREEDSEAAQEAFEGAFEGLLGVRPQVRIKPV